MPIFPTKENEIYALSARMLKGFQEHPADFPHINSGFFWTRRWQYRIRRRVHLNAVSRLRLATKDKNEKLKQLKSVMKDCLKKSRVDCHNDPKKLALIGWATDKQPSIMPPPGQPLNLRAISQARGTVTLKWDKSSNGSADGYVRNYLIQCREHKSDVAARWKLIDTVYDTQVSLTNQPCGVTLEYRVMASNAAGDSMQSNTVTVVL